MKRCALIALLVLLGLHATDVAAQIVVVKDELVNADSLRRAWDHGPNFGAYKDNYFIFGTAIGPKPTRQNDFKVMSVDKLKQKYFTVSNYGTTIKGEK